MKARLNIRLEDQQLQKLKEIAKDQKISVSKLIRQLIEEKLIKDGIKT